MIRHLGRLDALKIETKQENDFVSEVDRQAEQEIIRVIRRAYPGHSILAEESGRQGQSGTEWIIDPLDGTTNYLHGFPQFAVSIAVRQNNKLEVGVVYDPMLQELYVAVRGSGATLNDRRIRVTRRAHLDNALIGTGLPFKRHHDYDGYLKTLRVIMEKTAGVRRPGAASLDLAYVAAGRLDGFWEYDLKPWDMAAGALLIKEAGGIVTDPKGNADFLDDGNIVCGTPKVHQALLKIIRETTGQ
jgi:myo-inositol-1(or 4)-monophosphatase